MDIEEIKETKIWFLKRLINQQKKAIEKHKRQIVECENELSKLQSSVK